MMTERASTHLLLMAGIWFGGPECGSPRKLCSWHKMNQPQDNVTIGLDVCRNSECNSNNWLFSGYIPRLSSTSVILQLNHPLAAATWLFVEEFLFHICGSGLNVSRFIIFDNLSHSVTVLSQTDCI